MTGPLASAQRVVRIAVVGDPDTGKTSLISTAANDTFDARPVPVLPPTKLSPDYTPERIPLLLTDTSSQPEGSKVTDYVIQTSDAVVVCFDPRRPITLENVRQVWYPKIQKLNPDVPVILACCKSDKLLERDAVGIKERVERVAADLHNLECCLNCSSRHNRMVMDVFYYALKAVLYPLQPLYDRVDKTMKQAGVRAFQRVFKMCDLDKDGYLSDAELNYFQKACFNIELNPEELRGIKQVVRARCPAGLHESMPGQPGGLTLEGFLFLHALFIERGRMETVWQVLRRFGYNDELRLSSDLLDSVNYTYPNDLVLELSDAALSFLVSQFHLHDAAGDGLLAWEALQALFATAPAFPTEWQSERINRLLVAGTHGAVHNLDSFLARWRYCAMADPRGTVANLLYLGYDGLPQSLLERRTRRRVDRRRYGADMAARTTITCLVFGPRGAGKTSLIAALAGRSYDDITPGPMPGSPAPPLTAAAPVRSDLLPVWPTARGLSSTVGSPGFGGSGGAGSGVGGGDTERQGAAGAGAQGGDAGSSMSGAAGGGGGGGGGGGPGVSVSGGAGYSYGGGAPLERVLIMTEVPGMVMQEMVSEAALGGLPRSGGTVGGSGSAAASGAGALPPLLMPSATTISSAAQGGAPSSSSTSSSAASGRNAQQTSRAGVGGASGSSSSTAAGDGSSAAPGTSTSGATAAATAAATPTGLPWPSSAAMAGQLPDLSRCDVAVFVFDVSDAASWRRACDAAVVLASLPGCDTLPCVFVAAKEELGMAEELKREVQERCVELCIPEPVPASVQTGNLAHLYRYIVAAAINPSPHIPDTPARKARRRLHRQLLFGGLAAAGLLAGAYLVYSMVSSSSSSASTATSSSSTSGTSSSASATGVSSSRSHASPSYAAGSSGSSSTRAVVPASSLLSPSLTSSLAGSLEAKAKSWFS